MSYTCFEIEISDKVAHIKLSRPEKRNSMNLKFWDELPEIIGDIDREVRARHQRSGRR
jgi:enoyl-CoA hydratase